MAALLAITLAIAWVTGDRQVRRAVELLVQAIDRADRDQGRALLADLPMPELYRAAVTVMMRLVFLLSAEERGLLPLDEELYSAYDAVSTLHGQLRAVAQAQVRDMERRRPEGRTEQPLQRREPGGKKLLSHALLVSLALVLHGLVRLSLEPLHRPLVVGEPRVLTEQGRRNLRDGGA